MMDNVAPKTGIKFTLKQLFIVVSLLVVAIGFFSQEVIRRIETPYLTALMELESERTAELLGQASLEALISEDIPHLQTIVEQIGSKNESILLIEVYSVENKVLAVWQAKNRFQVKDYIIWEKNIILMDESFGSILLHWRTDFTDKNVDNHVAYLSYLALLLVIVVGVFYLLLTHYFVIKPIQLIDLNLRQIKSYHNAVSPSLDNEINIKVISPRNAKEIINLSETVVTLQKLFRDTLEQEKKLKSEIELRTNAELTLQKHKDSLEELVKEKTQHLVDAVNDSKNANQKTLDALNHLQETQQQLVENQKMAELGSLVAGVAHEVNTPVGICLTASTFLQGEYQDVLKKYQQETLTKSELTKFLDNVGESLSIFLISIEKAVKIIENFKQISIDQSADHKKIFYIRAYIEDTILSLRPVLKKHQHKIVVHCDQNLKVNSYPGCFYQIISNLILNSLFHAFEDKKDGTITIKVTYENNRLLLTYRDDGKGIDTKIKDTLFSPFVTTKRNQGGSGLGTHIIYNIVTQKLGGNISFESVTGQGVTFNINIPLDLC